MNKEEMRILLDILEKQGKENTRFNDDYNNIKSKYRFKIQEYIDKISKVMKVFVSCGSVYMTASAHIDDEAKTEINNCMNELYSILASDYPMVSPDVIKKTVNRIFEEEIVPIIKTRNDHKVKQTLNNTYWGNLIWYMIEIVIIGFVGYILANIFIR